MARCGRGGRALPERLAEPLGEPGVSAYSKERSKEHLTVVRNGYIVNGMSNTEFIAALILELEARAVATGPLTRDGLTLLRGAAHYRASRAMKGVAL